MPITKRAPARQPSTARRKTLPAAAITRARADAVAQQQRARRLATITAEREALDRLRAVAQAEARKLERREGVSRAVLDLLGTAAIPIGITLGHSIEERELVRLGCALPSEDLTETWRRLLCERGMSATEAARITSEQADHIRAIDIPDRDRKAATRAAARRRADVADRVRVLRAELAALAVEAPGEFDLRYLRAQRIEAEIAALDTIAKSLG